MDNDTERTSDNTVEPGESAASSACEGDSTSGTPPFANRHRMICMPSSRAIADAIIRRTVHEIRG